MKMIKSYLFRMPVTLIVALAVATPAVVNAGTIVVSGDANIANPLTGSFGAGVVVGNQTFFQNVLQGGTTVRVLQSVSAVGTDSTDLANTDIVSFYNTLPGVNCALVSGTVTSGTLAGVNLFVSVLPDDAFSASELAALSVFLTNGGSVFFLGDNNDPLFTTQNAFINLALANLGSGLAIVPDVFDHGFNDATTSQIASDTFTAGVTSFRYAAPSRVEGGTPLFFGSQQQPFLAYERMPVPESSSCALLVFGTGLMFFGFRRRPNMRIGRTSHLQS